MTTTTGHGAGTDRHFGEEGKRLSSPSRRTPAWTSSTTPVCIHKLDGGFRFKAVLSEHGSRPELMKGVAGA